MSVAQRQVESVSQEPRRLQMSYEEYLEWADDSMRLTEWVDGEVIIHMPPKDEHQQIVQFVYELLAQFVRISQTGLVRIAPFEVKLWPEGPSREPDVFFLASTRSDSLSSERLTGAPDLAVEVLSPSTLYIDRSQKFREYETAGVREYWIIDSRPGNQRADFYRLDESDRFELFATEADEVVHSTVLDAFWLKPAWLWQDPLPNPLRVLADIVGRDTLIEALGEAE